MPKEIAAKTKQETCYVRESAIYKGAGYKCLPVQILDYKICSGAHCGDEIFWNTHKKFTYCKCKKIWVDSCEDYIRIGGNEEDRKVIKK